MKYPLQTSFVFKTNRIEFPLRQISLKVRLDWTRSNAKRRLITSLAKVANLKLQQNRLIPILSKTYKQKVKLSSLYSKLNILKIEDIYNLEALKFMCKFKNKTLPTPFRNYFTPASNFYNYSTRNSKKGNYFSKVNKKLTQRSSKICGTSSVARGGRGAGGLEPPRLACEEFKIARF